MESKNYTITDNGNLEVKAGDKARIVLVEDVRYANIIIGDGASLQFIGDYCVSVDGVIIYEKVNMFPCLDDSDLHVVEFLG